MHTFHQPPRTPKRGPLSRPQKETLAALKEIADNDRQRGWIPPWVLAGYPRPTIQNLINRGLVLVHGPTQYRLAGWD